MLPNNDEAEKVRARTHTVFHLIIEEDMRLCRPVCASDCVHIAMVIVEQGHTRTRCDGDIASVTPIHRYERHRGSELDIGFYCENGHAFTYTWRFHKGSTTVAFDAVALPADDDGRWICPWELWRD